MEQLTKDRSDVPTERSTDEARQAVTGHNVRYVLGFSLAAVIVGMVIVGLMVNHG
jgi:hypothetical protein